MPSATAAARHLPTRAGAPAARGGGDDAQVRAPFAGCVVPTVAVGDRVCAGQVVAVIEAVKLEAAVTSRSAGVVARVAVLAHASVEGGDVLVELSAVGAGTAPGAGRPRPTP